MQTSSRDKLLMLILPALVVLLFYAIFFSLPHYRSMVGLEKSLKTARDSIPSHAQVHATQHKLADLNREIAQLKKAETALAKSWDELASPCLASASRSERLSRLIAILSKHGIHVVHHGPVDGAGDVKDLKLSASQERLAALMSERDDKKKPQTWRLQLAGRYSEVTQALQCLAGGEPVAIPLGVVMKEALPATNVHEWWMYVWI